MDPPGTHPGVEEGRLPRTHPRKPPPSLQAAPHPGRSARPLPAPHLPEEQLMLRGHRPGETESETWPEGWQSYEREEERAASQTSELAGQVFPLHRFSPPFGARKWPAGAAGGVR